jgi:hypothetical protein
VNNEQLHALIKTRVELTDRIKHAGGQFPIDRWRFEKKIGILDDHLFNLYLLEIAEQLEGGR